MTSADTVNRIVRFKPNGLPVVSLYARVAPAPPERVANLRSQVESQLREIQPMAEDRKLGRDAMMSIRGDIDKMMDVAGQQRWSPGAVAMFSCSGRGFFEVAELPRGVRDRVMVDETPWVRPMLAVLDEYHRCCVAVVDRVGARIWELYQDQMSEVCSLSVDADPGRDQDKLREVTKKHYRDVVTTLDKLYRDGRFELLIIGGHRPQVPRVVEFLTHELRPLLAGTFEVDDDSRSAFGEIKRQAIVIVDHYERAEEERMVAAAVDTQAAGGLAVLDLPQCLWAGSVAAVERLLVQDGALAPGVVCDRDRWLALGGETCPLCDRPVRHTPDVVDELAQIVMDESGSVEHVSADSVLKERIAAAFLRFPLPPQP